jgi:hypothetical protein
LEYISLWGNNFDEKSSEDFSKLLGGPSSVVMINSRLTSTRQETKSRLSANSTDITFTLVESVLQVARV